MNIFLQSEHLKEDVCGQLDIIPFFKYKDFIDGKNINIESKFKKNTVHTTTVYEEFLNVRDEKDITYIINNNGHRSDNFITDHKNKHVLFSGCSYTFGESLPYMENWSGKLYNKLIKKENLSGYFNLSYPGGGIDIIINNIYKYCNKYGNPNTIFLFLPEASRKMIWHNNKYYSVMSGNNNFYDLYWGKENAIYDIFHKIKNLENFCKNSGIKLFWSTWSEQDKAYYKLLKFDRYINIEINDIINMSTNYKEIDMPYYRSARDGSHPGKAYSDGLSNIFLKEYNEDL